jgi:hypothetical protein
MAISKNLLMQGVRGAIGKQLVFRVYGTKQVVSAYPDMSERKLSAAQVRRTKVMKQANAELKKIKADKQKRDAAQLRLNVPSNKLHHALLSELLLKYGKK